MGFEVVETPDLPAPGQFSQVVKKGPFVFISGQTAAVAAGEGNLDPVEQAREIFGYLKKAIESAGGRMSDICKTPAPFSGIAHPSSATPTVADDNEYALFRA